MNSKYVKDYMLRLWLYVFLSSLILFKGCWTVEGVTNRTEPVDTNNVTASDEELAWRKKELTRRDLMYCHEIRVKRLQQKCAELNLAPNRSMLYYDDRHLVQMVEKMIVDGRHRVLMKAIPKTGTSSWKMILLNNTGLLTLQQGDYPPGGGINNYTMLEEYGLYTLEKYPRFDILYRLQSYFSVLNVRHPLSRLESAYRNKLASGNKAYETRVGSRIMQRYGQGRYSEEDIASGKNVPFHMFLRWLVRTQDKDPHWRRFVDEASPCLLPYSHVTKTETADDDMDFIVSSKLSRTGQGGHYHYNPSRHAKPTDEHGRPILPLFSSIAHRQKLLDKVLHHLKADLELFGYRVLRNNHGQLVADCTVRSPAMKMCC